MDASTIFATNQELANAIIKYPWLSYLIALQIVTKIIFYPWALYKAAERKQKMWFAVLFVAMFILNDFGIFPILYLTLTRKKFTSDLKVKKKTKK